MYRRFESSRQPPLVKPRFLIEDDGSLKLLPSPLGSISEYERYLSRPRDILELGQNDYWYRRSVYANPLHDYSATVRLATAVWDRLNIRYFSPDRMLSGGVLNETSTAFLIQTALLEKFVAEVRASGAEPLIVIIPQRPSIERVVSGPYWPAFGFIAAEADLAGLRAGSER